MADCPTCRTMNPAGANVCGSCGVVLPGRTPSPPFLADGLGTTMLGHPQLDSARTEPADDLPCTTAAPHALRSPPVEEPRSDATWFGVATPALTLDSVGTPPRVRDAARKHPLADRHRVRMREPGRSPLALAGAKLSARNLWLLAGLGVALAAAAGGLLALLTGRGPTLLLAGFEVTFAATDLLTVTCQSCPDGARLRLGASESDLGTGVARLETAGALPVGRNVLSVSLLTPDGEVQLLPLVVPVAFRVSTDLSGVDQRPAFARVIVLAEPGARVTIDGATVPLEAGAASARIVLTGKTSGLSALPEEVTRDVAIRVLTGARERRTKVKVQALIVPLLLSPSPSPTAPMSDVTLEGRTGARASIRAFQQGRNIGETFADGKGRFSLTLARPTSDDCLLVASLPGHLSREIAVSLVR